MPNSHRRKPPLGEATHTQILNMYGPGAMVDLPDHAVLIGGLDFWNDRGCEHIHEPRLLQLVRQATGSARIDLKTPPKEVDPLKNISGSLKALRFPEWSVVQKKIPDRIAFGIYYRARLLIHYNDSCINNWQKFADADGEYPLVPVRFVRACPHGHLSDIRWRDFCFNQFGCKKYERLYLLEAGTGNDYTQIFVQSESGVTRRLSDALIPNTKALGRCQGHTPWLGRYSRDSEPCMTNQKPTYYRLLVRSATNAYFNEILSVISLPEAAGSLSKRVTEMKDELKVIEEESDIVTALKFNPRLKRSFADVDISELWSAIKVSRDGGFGNVAQPKDEELRLLTGPMDGVSSSKKDSLFEATPWEPTEPPLWFKKSIKRVLLVKRLREVKALVGFTRFTSRTSSLGGLPIESTKTNARAPLSNNLQWVPASENKGEGIFIEFDSEMINAWASTDAVSQRSTQFSKAFEGEWLKSRGLDSDQFPFPGAPYILLHSLSHLLITEMALECGYGASSIRERIYANPEIGYGILLLTSTSGSEGTLGGLLDAGKRIVSYLERAFERGQLCSNDPFCSEHDPNHDFDIRPTHGAACHGCELIAETSCEQRNEFLDRSLVSRTVSIHDKNDDPSFWSFINPDQS